MGLIDYAYATFMTFLFCIRCRIIFTTILVLVWEINLPQKLQFPLLILSRV
jgi:hypothetical protein